MTIERGYFLCFYIQMISYAFPLWFGIRNYKYLDKPLKIFFLSVAISFLIDSTSWVLSKLHIQDHYLSYLFTLNAFVTKILICNIYIQNQKYRKYFLWTALLIIPLFIFDYFWLFGDTKHNALSGGASQFWIFIATIYCLRQLINETPTNIRQKPFFWIFVGTIMAKGFTFFDTIAYDYVLNSSVTMVYILSAFTYLINGVENILYAIGLQRAKK